MKKETMIRRIAAVIAAVMLLLFATPAFAADTYDSGDEYLDPIPLLVIKVSYDANGNGQNDFDMTNGSKLYADKTALEYGEQWCHSSDDYWANMLFKNNDSMMNFYKQNSNGNFWFSPAEENYADVTKNGAANDGVINVTVKYKHPYAQTGNQSNEHTASRVEALKQADNYVDFASFDKDGSGTVDYDELAIVFVCGGYEYSAGSSRPSDRHAFGVHAHYTTGSGAKLDGVNVGTSGFVRVGEYVGASTQITMGVIAHELGHFIGAADLYDANGKWTYVGNMSLMASGSWNNKSGPRGTAPAFMDPFNELVTGIATSSLIVEDGEYTLYSHNSKAGDYNILKITTQNPLEYYLIENRYAGSTPFESTSASQSGIVIWHIDESITGSSGLSNINTSGKGHEPGVVIMSPTSLSSQNCGFMFKDGSLNGQSYTFNPSATKYRFPVNGGSYTLLTDEEAAEFNVLVSVSSYAGDEMKITVSGIVNIMPTYTAGSFERTDSSIGFGGRIIDFNGGDITSCELIISKNANPTEENGTKLTCTVNDDMTYGVSFTGLEANTKYFCRVTITGKYGTSEKIVVGYTKAVFKPRTDYFVVYLYRSLTDVERSYEIKIKPGATLSYNFPMTKNGFEFCGWYLDSELTQRYDMGFTQTECKDFSLYAKWVSPENTSSLKLVNAEAKYKLFAAEVGDTYTVPTPAERDGYSFGGWYADAEFTVEFDFEQRIEEAGETEIYAKWVKNEEPVPESTTTVIPEEITSSNVTGTETSATTDGNEGKSGTTAIIVIVVIAVLMIAAAAFYIFTRRKK